MNSDELVLWIGRKFLNLKYAGLTTEEQIIVEMLISKEYLKLVKGMVKLGDIYKKGNIND